MMTEENRPTVVAGCGAIAVDEILILDRAFAAGKGRVNQRETTYGGNIATALAAVSTLGGSGRWLGYLSGGEEWQHVRDDLASYDIDIDGAQASDAPPIRSTILVQPNGDRFIAFDDDTLIGAGPDVDASALEGADILLIDAYAAANGLSLVDQAEELGVPVVVDLERADTDNSRTLVERANHLVIPLEMGRSLINSDDPQNIVGQLWSRSRHAVILTDGENGAWYRTADGAGHVPAFTVDVVDTSGCGDVFHGAYALAIGQGAAVAEAVRSASAAAALCATAVGGRGRLPTTADVHTLLRR